MNNPPIKNTVTVRLLGGLGNQMFQYASALGLAMRQNRELFLDISSFEAYKTWPYQLDCLDVPQDIYQGPPLAVPTSNTLKDRIVRKLKGGYTLRAGIYKEPHYHYDPEINALSDEEILLEGYFQSALYFAGAEDLIRERFQPKRPLTNSASSWAEKITKASCSISLHVRRGDYLSEAASGTHTALDKAYYNRAITLMKDLVGKEAEFFLFSDDPDFITEAFRDLPNAHIVRPNPLDSSSTSASWEDMFLMAKCHHNIIANSSYSWWGAWLNAHEKKRVIAPASWFTSEKLANRNALDVYPDGWILLK